jgi:hypothetical protein
MTFPHPFRSPIRLPDGRIDVEFEHPTLGWLPFTADPADPEEQGRALHARLLADETAGLITVPDAPQAPAAPPPDLTTGQWAWLLASQTPAGTFYEDMIGHLLTVLKAADPESYRLLQRRVNGTRFLFADTIALIPAFWSLLSPAFPDDDMPEPADLMVLWLQAAAQVD